MRKEHDEFYEVMAKDVKVGERVHTPYGEFTVIRITHPDGYVELELRSDYAPVFEPDEIVVVIK